MKTMLLTCFLAGLLCSVCCPTPNRGEQISPLDVARASQHDAHGNRSSQGLVETLPALDQEENARKTNTDPVHPQRPPLSRVHEDEGSEKTEGNRTVFTEKENQSIHSNQLIHSHTTKELVWKPLQENARDGKSHDAPSSKESPKLVNSPGNSSMQELPLISSLEAYNKYENSKNNTNKKVGNKINEQPSRRIPRDVDGTCYKDVSNKGMENRDLNGSCTEFTSDNSPTTCKNHCKSKGFKYAALQNAYLCFCSNSFGRYGKSPGRCFSSCPGDQDTKCGGRDRNSVYITGYKPPVQQTFLDGIERKPVFENVKCSCGPCEQTWINRDMNNFYGQMENIALGKRVSGTDSLRGFRHCALTNGVWTETDDFWWICVDPIPPFCYHSGSYLQYPFVDVDLGSVITMEDFTLVRRDKNTQYDRSRMLGVEVLMDGKMCYEYPKYSEGCDFQCTYDTLAKNIERVTNNKCKEPLTGQYVRIRKAQESNETMNIYHLVVCELYVWVCEPGYYGSKDKGCTPCPEDCDLYCNNYYGCEETPRTYDIGIHKQISVSITATENTNHVNDGSPFIKPNKDCFQMESYSEPLWLRVYLEKTYFVDAFTISALDRGASDFLKSFSVLVTIDTTLLNNPSYNDQKCFEYRRTVQDMGQVEGRCIRLLQGKYVWVTTTWIKLGFCELEVMGRLVQYLPHNSDCIESSRDHALYQCSPTAICEDRKCKTKVNEECTNNTDCVQGSVCEYNTCKKNTNFPCETNKDECRRGHACDTFTKICRLDHGQSCKDNEDICRTNAVCDDTLHLCGLKVNETCTTTSQCTAGATCSEETCQCQSELATSNGTQCNPSPHYIGSACTSPAQCNSSFCHNDECSCSPSQEVYPQGFNCKLKAGGQCSQQTECNTGMECEGGHCKITLHGLCEGNEEHCKSGYECDATKTCKKALDQSCSGSDECKQGDTCFGQKCKIVNGGICSTSEYCASGFCENPKCKIDVGHKCTNDTADHCRQGSFCEENVCKFDLKEQCTDDIQCQIGAVCSDRASHPTKQCRWTMGHGCEDDTDCEKIAFCDNLKQCRIPKYGNCTNHRDKCLSGGFCPSNGNCTCTTVVTKTGTETCEPGDQSVGGYCTPSQTNKDEECLDTHAHCNYNSSKCQCTENLVTDPSNLECRIDFGCGCSTIINVAAQNPECISGAVCNEGGRCAAGVGSSCEGHKLNMCKMGTRCDTDYICRLELHQSCVDYPNGCRKGTICDIFKRCKYLVGQMCTKHKECMAATHCSEGKCQCFSPASVEEKGSGNCVIKRGLVGGRCEGTKCKDDYAVCNRALGKCECKGRYAVDPWHLSCGKRAGEPCRPTGNKEEDGCAAGLVCDPVHNKCRIQAGERCDGELTELCVTDVVCDYDHVCRLKLRGDCKEDRSVFCRSGTLCDTLGQCSNPIGGTCSDHSDCQAGATCVKSTCVCNTDISTTSGAVCRPKDGQYMGSCQADCTIKNSKCDNGLCKCIDGATPNRLLECAFHGSQLGQMPTTIISLVVVLAIVCAVIGGAVGYVRYRHKTTEREDIATRGAETMHALKVLGQAVHQIETFGEEHEQATLGDESSTYTESSVAPSSTREESDMSTAPTSEISSAQTRKIGTKRG